MPKESFGDYFKAQFSEKEKKHQSDAKSAPLETSHTTKETGIPYTKEHGVQDENDQYAFRKETDKQSRPTEKIGHVEAGWLGWPVEGALRGGKFAFMLPWKGFMAGFGSALDITGFGNIADFKTGFGAGLSVFLDQDKTNKMLERIFGKKEKKEKTKIKGKEEPKQTYAKERETKLKIKAIEKKYLHGFEPDKLTDEKIKERLTDEKTEELKLLPEYQNLNTDEIREMFITHERIKNEMEWKEHRKAWANLRKGWIADSMWDNESEEEFRNIIEFDPKNPIHREKYMLTPKEYKELKDTELRRSKKQKELSSSNIDDVKLRLERDIKRLDEDIEEINIKALDRSNKTDTEWPHWPPYKKGDDKKGRERSMADREQEALDDEDDSQEEN